MDLPGVLTRYSTIDPDVVPTLAADARWQHKLTLDGVPIHLGRLINPGTPPDTPQALRYPPSERLAALVRTRDFGPRTPASADLDTLETLIDADTRRHARAHTGVTATPTTTPAPRPPPSDDTTYTDDEPPPF